MRKLILPPTRGYSKLAAALNTEPPQKSQFNHIATITSQSTLKACAAANLARWVLRK